MVAEAFAAAKNNAFTLLVDCPAYIHVGSDILRPIFIESGTTVEFSPDGLFVIDNAFVPTWVIANSEQVVLAGWRIKYVGGLPVDPDTKGYTRDGTFVPMNGKYQPAAAFHDRVLTPWLTAHRGIVFDRGRGPITSPWPGPTATSAVFYILGSATSIDIRGMNMFVPEAADGSRFIPVCFLTTVGYKNDQVVTAATPVDANSASIPSDIQVSNLVLDGAYMGWLGQLKDSRFERVRSFRYGDLQDEKGNYVGGIGKWFAPPHLFYLTITKGSEPQSERVKISDVLDWGERAGVARDTDPTNRSGYALSLKIGAIDSEVRNYVSYRPDGFLDVLRSERLVIEGVKGQYDSSFLNNLYPGVRFPVGPYRDVLLENFEIEDRARSAAVAPIGGVSDRASANISLRNISAKLHSPSNKAKTLPDFLGKGHSIDVRIESD